MIHWGTACSPQQQHANLPRVSIGFNFLREGERLQKGAPLLDRADAKAPTPAGRLSIIARSLLVYSPWYELESKMIPDALFIDSTP